MKSSSKYRVRSGESDSRVADTHFTSHAPATQHPTAKEKAESGLACSRMPIHSADLQWGPLRIFQ